MINTNMFALSEEEKARLALVLDTKYQQQFRFYQPHAKQTLFHEAGKIAKERLFLAGNRTGKTYSASVEVSMHLTGVYPSWWQGYRYDHPVSVWVVGPSNQVVRDTLQKQYYLGDADKGTLGLIHLSLIANVQKARGIPDAIDTVYVRHASGGVSKLTFKSYEQGREKFQGDKINIIHIDEECPKPIYSECLIRTTTTEKNFHGMIIVSMTPLKGRTELICHFTEDRMPETLQHSRWHVVATWDDNPHLTEEEKQRLMAAMTEQEREARMKGIPWTGSGLVYPVLESKLIVKDFDIPKHWPRSFGIDFGWTHPTALIFGAHDQNNDVLYLYAEYAVSQCTPQQHAYNLLNFGINWIPGVYDPAGRGSQQGDGKTLVELYAKAGITNLSVANNDKQRGILTVLQRMRAGQLKIFESLKKTRSELHKYAYNEKGVPNDKDDHLMDAMRYLVMSGLGIGVPENYKESSYDGKYYSDGVATYI